MWPRGRPAVPLHSDPPGGLSQAHAHRCLPLSAPGLPGDRRGLRTPLQRAPLPCPAAGTRTPRPALFFLRCCSFRPGPAEFPGTAALQEAVSGCLARGAGVGEAAPALLRPPPRPPPFSGALRPGPRGLPEGASLPSLSSRRAQPTRRRSVSAARGGTVRSSWTATCKSTQQSGTQHITQQADRTPRDAVTRTRRRDATRRHDANVTHDAVTRT